MGDELTDVERYLGVGCPISFDSDPSQKSSPRYSSTLRGWRSPAYILIDRPTVGGRSAPVQENQPCVVRFVHGGRACAFDTVVLDWDDRQHNSYCRISWPESVHTVSFRKAERVRVNVPCDLQVQGSAVQGRLVDISTGGCRLYVEPPHAVGTEALLSATLPGGRAIEHVQCVVRDVHEGPDGKPHTGCEFVRGQVTVESDIALFVAESLGRGQQEASDAPRVLVIEQDPKRAMVMRRLFESRGIETVLTTGTVDGASSLRLSHVQAAVVSQTQDDLPGALTVRLIKRTRGLESLPVFLYGGDGEDLAAQAREAGVTQHLAAGMNVPEIVGEVAKHLIGAEKTGD